MTGKTKKKSSGKKKVLQKPAKYVVAPASPIVTCASGKKSRIPADDLSASAVHHPATPTPPPPAVSAIGDLEKKFDTRMAQMETSFCSALSDVSIGSSIRPPSFASVQEVVADHPPENSAVIDPGSSTDRPGRSSSGHHRHPRRHRHCHGSSPRRSRHRSPTRRDRHRSPSGSSRSSSSSSSSSSSGSSRSSSSESDYSSSRHRRCHQRHRSHRRSRSRSKSKKSKYDTSKYLVKARNLIHMNA